MSEQQLSLLEWSEKQKLLTDLGGRCSYCLEHDNWLMTDRWEDEEHNYYTLQCQTVMKTEDGDFNGLCGNTEELVEARRE